jgi:hypothetical protein
MATTDEQDRLVEQARAIAVSLEAENALVASLVLAADERDCLRHSIRAHAHGVKASGDCPACQLLAWARASA